MKEEEKVSSHRPQSSFSEVSAAEMMKRTAGMSELTLHHSGGFLTYQRTLMHFIFIHYSLVMNFLLFIAIRADLIFLFDPGLEALCDVYLIIDPPPDV